VVKTKPRVIRVVLDTNVLVSALLFGGLLNRLVVKWKSGAVVPVFSRATFEEFRRVLAYPRFALTESEIRVLIEDEVLPYFDVVETCEVIPGACRDPGDDIFLACAVAAGVDAIVSGDKDLLDMGCFREIPIISVREFLK
jgi:putative PIN family toxin of toxin-antitoxin system